MGSTSTLSADLTGIPPLDPGAEYAALSAGASLSADATVLRNVEAHPEGTASLTAHLTAAWSVAVNVPASDPTFITADLSAGSTFGVGSLDNVLLATIDPGGALTPGSPAADAAGADAGKNIADGNWHSFTFKLPGKNALMKVSDTIETLVTYLEVVKAVLETIKTFLVDFGNPIKALAEAILRLLNQLFELLKQGGISAFYDVPEVWKDPLFLKMFNGAAPFTTRFKGSLFDIRDPNRPQPVAGATKSGFILFVVDSGSALQLVRNTKQLLRFFGKDLGSPQYAPPMNFKAFPVGDKQDPILAVARVFSDQPKAIAIEWSAPTNQQPPDAGFSDLVTTLGTEFGPPKYLIEKSEVPLNQDLDASALNDPGSAGTVYLTYESGFEARGKPGKRLKRKVKLTDEYGDPFIKFPAYTVLQATDDPTDPNPFIPNSAFLLGQLGKFRFIDTNVEFNKTYYYRVRAFSGRLKVESITGKIHFDPPKPDDNGRDKSQNKFLVRWPGVDKGSPPIMGRASPIVRARLSRFPPNFDVITNLRDLFKTAFSLGFHMVPQPTDKFDPQGNPISPTPNYEVGMGSLQRQASGVAAFVTSAVASAVTPTASALKPDPVTNTYPEMPWTNTQIVWQSARLANTMASALLEAGSEKIQQFQQIMQGTPLPKGAVSSDLLSGANTIEKLCTALVGTDAGAAAAQVDGTKALRAAQIYNFAFNDVTYRKNILYAIQFTTTLSLGGVPPDWVKVSILRDIVPWSGQFLYDMLAKIQALVDAYRGVMDEIKDFIDLLIRKIDAMERFVQYLISLLDYIESLEVGCYVLAVPESSGGVQDWIQAIDNATGNKPSLLPNGYSAGVALAYVYPDFSPFGPLIAKAWNAIF